MTIDSSQFSCSRCGSESQPTDKFCAHCGWERGRSYHSRIPTLKQLSIVSGVAVLVCAAGWGAQKKLGGTPPTAAFQQKEHPASSGTSVTNNDPEIVKLRAAAEAAPGDKRSWQVLASALAEKLNTNERPNPEIVFEAIGALRKILDIDPHDKEALLAMAEISFNQQAFSKATEFYEKYLTEVPEDLDVRARYASSLSFTGQFEKSLKELDQVLSVQPKHFHALAYSAVAYAEMGRKSEALSAGEKALELAPSPEARARFSDFLKTVHDHDFSKSAPQAAPELPASVQEIVGSIQSNSVAGPKFAHASLSGEVLTLSFQDFPMSQMPPFVREKFIGGLKEKALKTPVKVLRFVDASSGEDLVESVTVTSSRQ